tara:strand:+ start:967 stop:1212 length:246 start_codon:yes stop_codon:yes gene_type:complete
LAEKTVLKIDRLDDVSFISFSSGLRMQTTFRWHKRRSGAFFKKDATRLMPEILTRRNNQRVVYRDTFLACIAKTIVKLPWT